MSNPQKAEFSLQYGIYFYMRNLTFHSINDSVYWIFVHEQRLLSGKYPHGQGFIGT